MKSIKITLLALLPIFATAQNYQQICSPGIIFFKAPDDNLKAFRKDSVYNPGGNDTVFFSYRTLRDTFEFACRDTTNGSVLGLKIFKKNDGTFYFFNRQQDTLYLKTQATLNQSWRFISLGNGSWMQATVTQKGLDSVLGNIDSVKVISFQAKDMNGQNISHLMNGRQIRLSKRFGLSKMFDIFWFPADTTLYTLCGKTYLSLGTPDISWYDIYNYDIGDEFEFSGYIQFYPSAHKDYSIIKKIIDKQVFTNPDSVLYIEEYCKHSELYTNQGIIVENTFDTVHEGFNFSAMAADLSIKRLPEEFVPYYISSGWGVTEYKRNLTGTWGKITQEMDYGDIYSYSPPCYGGPFESAGSVTFSVGLGQTSFFSAGVMEDSYSESLVYFKKGAEVWGTPVAADCATLVPVEDHKQPVPVSVDIIPNPVINNAEVRISGVDDITGMTFRLFDNLGREVLNIPLAERQFTLNCGGIKPGLYIYRLSNSIGVPLAFGKVIVS